MSVQGQNLRLSHCGIAASSTPMSGHRAALPILDLAPRLSPCSLQPLVTFDVTIDGNAYDVEFCDYH
jgi:hypothetical protein